MSSGDRYRRSDEYAYSPPRHSQPSSSSSSKNRDEVYAYSPPRHAQSSSSSSSSYRSRNDRYSRSSRHKRSRSRSPEVKEEIRLDDDRDDRSYRSSRKRSRSRTPEIKDEKRDFNSYGQYSMYTKEDQEAIRNLFCRICSVKLHDEGSMKSHVDGRPHLAMKTKIAANDIRKESGMNLLDSMKPEPGYLGVDEKFWIKKEQETKIKLARNAKEEAERFDEMESKFDRKNYDRGQFKYNFFCDLCQQPANTRDIWESHLQGKEHKRQAAKHPRFECTLCLISVPCQDTLNNHMRGRDHLKRSRELEEQKRYRKRMAALSEDGEGAEDTKRQLEEEKKKNAQLKRSLGEQVLKRNACLRNHSVIEKARLEYAKAKEDLEDQEYEEKRLMRELEDLKKRSGLKFKKEEKREYTEDEATREMITID